MMDFPEGFFYIKSRLSNKVVDVDGASLRADAKILLWRQKFDSDRDNQLWYYQDGYIISKKSRKVLDIRGGVIESNTLVCQYDRKLIQNADNQRFGYSAGFIYCLADPRYVLDIRGGADTDGSRIIIHLRKLYYEDHETQLWDLEVAGEERTGEEAPAEEEEDKVVDVLFDIDVREEQW